MNVKTFIKKYTMVIALVVVFIFFTILTGGKLVLAQNISNLLLQNAYVLDAGIAASGAKKRSAAAGTVLRSAQKRTARPT